MATHSQGKKVAKPKYKVGQVVSVMTFNATTLKRRHAVDFARITRILPPDSPYRENFYSFAGWTVGRHEEDLRPLTKREKG